MSALQIQWSWLQNDGTRQGSFIQERVLHMYMYVHVIVRTCLPGVYHEYTQQYLIRLRAYQILLSVFTIQPASRHVLTGLYHGNYNDLKLSLFYSLYVSHCTPVFCTVVRN